MPHQVVALLPPVLGQALKRLPEAIAAGLQEIRIREGRPLEAVYDGGFCFVSAEGHMLARPEGAYAPSRRDTMQLLDLLTDHSLYAMEEQLRRGFITVRGGHRVGLSGRTVLEGGSVKLIKDISGFNIRLARERPGLSAPFLPLLRTGAAISHTLIVSPPMGGKTTLLRDLARAASSGEWAPSETGAGRMLKVGVVDERSEIAACWGGVPAFDLGPRTDVLDGCPKAEGMMMMIRSMSPDLIAVDELGRPEDAAAVREALHAGIRVAATVHGSGHEDILRRPTIRELVADGVFERIVVLGGFRNGGLFNGAQILDGSGRRIHPFRTAKEAAVP